MQKDQRETSVLTGCVTSDEKRTLSGPGLSKGMRTLGVFELQLYNYSQDERTAASQHPVGATQAVTPFVSSDLSCGHSSVISCTGLEAGERHREEACLGYSL